MSESADHSSLSFTATASTLACPFKTSWLLRGNEMTGCDVWKEGIELRDAWP